MTGRVNLRHCISKLFALILICSSFTLKASLDISVEAEAAILMNALNGRVLFEKNAHKPAYPASTTKIATALLALHKSKHELDRIFVAEREALVSITPQAKKQSNYRSPPYWIESDSTHIGLKKGEEMTLSDLLKGMLICSGNDASNVIAYGLSHSIPKFMGELNDYLKNIGCQKTHFNNPHGLHHPEHITTAYDLALMAKEGLKEPIFRSIVSTPRYCCPQTNLEEERIFTQTNLLLKKGAHFYPHAIGVKTGYTGAAGKNLVAAAQNGQRMLIAVALGYRGPRAALYQDIVKMFEKAFHEPKMRRTLLFAGPQQFSIKVPGSQGTLRTTLASNLNYDFYASEEEGVKLGLTWTLAPLPIEKGSIVGKVRVVDLAGRTINEAPLLASESLKATWWHPMRVGFSKNKTLFFVIGGILVLAGFSGILQRRKRGNAGRRVL